MNLAEVKRAAEQARDRIAELAAGCDRPVRIFFHWTAGHYRQYFDDYHFNIDDDGTIVATTDDLAAIKAHTWHRNTGAVGIGLCCAYQANSINNLGPEPPTAQQVDAAAQVAAVLCKVFDLQIDADHVLTHAEAADLDGYGPNSAKCERWDLYVLAAGDPAGTGGDLLRAAAQEYIDSEKLNWLFI